MSNVIIPKQHRSYVKPTKPVKSVCTIGDGTPRSACIVEDAFTVKLVLAGEAMADLTKDGIKMLRAMLEENGFDLMLPYERYDDYPQKNQVTFFQYRDWRDDDHAGEAS